jgi:hypothetical protein
VHYKHLVTLSLLSFCAVVAQAQGNTETTAPTVIYLVRHGEVVGKPPYVLSERRKAQAEAFAATVANVGFTHVFSSHTTRARQMVEPVAAARHLSVVQLPAPEDKTVNDDTPARNAVQPLLKALRELPGGSTALVGVNSDNVYGIVNGLGVPVAPSGQACQLGSTCVPCLNNSCFPSEQYDHFWIVITNARGPKMIELRLGVPIIARKR